VVHAHRRWAFIPYQAVLVLLTQFWSQWVQLGDALSFVRGRFIDDDYVGIIRLVIPTSPTVSKSYAPVPDVPYKTMSEMIESRPPQRGDAPRRVSRRIVLPPRGPMFAVVLIYQSEWIWNDLPSLRW